MKKYIYLLLLIILALAIGNWHYLKIKSQENHVLHWQYVQDLSAEKRNLEMLVLGDSYAAYSIRSECNPAFLNFAFPGDNYRDMFEKLRYSIQKFKIDLVLLSLDQHLFKKHVKKISSKYNLLFENKEEVFMRKYSKFPLLIEHNRIEYGKILGTRMYHAFKSGSNSKSIYYDEDWNLRRSIQHNWQLKINKEKVLSETIENFFSNSKNFESNFKYIDSIKILCNNNNLKLIAYSNPVSNEFYDLASQLEPQLQEQIQEKVQLYSIPYLNYQLALKDDQHFFMDPVHVNDLGAKAITKIICSDLDSLRSVLPSTLSFVKSSPE